MRPSRVRTAAARMIQNAWRRHARRPIHVWIRFVNSRPPYRITIPPTWTTKQLYEHVATIQNIEGGFGLTEQHTGGVIPGDWPIRMAGIVDGSTLYFRGDIGKFNSRNSSRYELIGPRAGSTVRSVHVFKNPTASDIATLSPEPYPTVRDAEGKVYLRNERVLEPDGKHWRIRKLYTSYTLLNRLYDAEKHANTGNHPRAATYANANIPYAVSPLGTPFRASDICVYTYKQYVRDDPKRSRLHGGMALKRTGLNRNSISEILKRIR